MGSAVGSCVGGEVGSREGVFVGEAGVGDDVSARFGIVIVGAEIVGSLSVGDATGLVGLVGIVGIIKVGTTKVGLVGIF